MIVGEGLGMEYLISNDLLKSKIRWLRATGRALYSSFLTSHVWKHFVFDAIL